MIFLKKILRQKYKDIDFYNDFYNMIKSAGKFLTAWVTEYI